MLGLPCLFADDPRGASTIAVRPFLGYVDPSLGLKGLKDAINGGILDAKKLADLLGGRRSPFQKAQVRSGLLPREAQGSESADRVLFLHATGQVRALLKDYELSSGS